MQPKVKRRFLPKIKAMIGILCVVLFVGMTAKFILVARSLTLEVGLTPLTLFKLIFNTGATLASTDGRTNVLVLGIAGGSHAGRDLTDTILLLSLNQNSHSMHMISVPRDIWSETLKDKVNSAYHYGEEKKEGGGKLFTKVEVEDILDIPIHYTVVIDFSGFKNVIDLAGGVTVDVPNTFTDVQFPIEGKEDDLCDGDILYRCRYESLHFEQGAQSMNGEMALKYVRSRHAQGDEGSDFARGRRQQEVFVSLKEKLTHISFWISPKKTIQFLQAVDNATDTDMNMGELLTVGKLIANTESTNTYKIGLEEFFLVPPLWMYGGRYVLVPKNSFLEVHEFIKNSLR